MGTGSILALVGLVIGVGLLFMVLGVGALVVSVVSLDRGIGQTEAETDMTQPHTREQVEKMCIGKSEDYIHRKFGPPSYVSDHGEWVYNDWVLIYSGNSLVRKGEISKGVRVDFFRGVCRSIQ